ncbi:hypothetical protein NECAME_05862 [Necator americanus]|uniref:Uncharacterized protein n=1 Tax=Necator americanus TaxID=51031 RepID=W2U026_NECAM|nr:hypothetical protein NECAME_05862 [Necator americanus]ETN86686.1 hypothetical protein NECAME_05862 [Necator americanus]
MLLNDAEGKKDEVRNKVCQEMRAACSNVTFGQKPLELWRNCKRGPLVLMRWVLRRDPSYLVPLRTSPHTQLHHNLDLVPRFEYVVCTVKRGASTDECRIYGSALVDDKQFFELWESDQSYSNRIEAGLKAQILRKPTMTRVVVIAVTKLKFDSNRRKISLFTFRKPRTNNVLAVVLINCTVITISDFLFYFLVVKRKLR